MLQKVRINSLRADDLDFESEKLNELDHFGYSLLHYAAIYGHYDILQMLINKGAGKLYQTELTFLGLHYYTFLLLDD